MADKKMKNHNATKSRFKPILNENLQLFDDLIIEDLENKILSSECKKESESNDNVSYGRWSRLEHFRFLEGIVKYRNYWKKVQEHVATRSCIQVRSHAQKFFIGLRKILRISTAKGKCLNFSTIERALTKQVLGYQVSLSQIKSLLNEENIKKIVISMIHSIRNTKADQADNDSFDKGTKPSQSYNCSGVNRKKAKKNTTDLKRPVTKNSKDFSADPAIEKQNNFNSKEEVSNLNQSPKSNLNSENLFYFYNIQLSDNYGWEDKDDLNTQNLDVDLSNAEIDLGAQIMNHNSKQSNNPSIVDNNNLPSHLVAKSSEKEMSNSAQIVQTLLKNNQRDPIKDTKDKREPRTRVPGITIKKKNSRSLDKLRNVSNHPVIIETTEPKMCSLRDIAEEIKSQEKNPKGLSFQTTQAGSFSLIQTSDYPPSVSLAEIYSMQYENKKGKELTALDFSSTANGYYYSKTTNHTNLYSTPAIATTDTSNTLNQATFDLEPFETFLGFNSQNNYPKEFSENSSSLSDFDVDKFFENQP